MIVAWMLAGCGGDACDLVNDVQVGDLSWLDEGTLQMEIWDRNGLAIDRVALDGRPATLASPSLWNVAVDSAQPSEGRLEAWSICGVSSSTSLTVPPADPSSIRFVPDAITIPELADTTLVVEGQVGTSVDVLMADDWLVSNAAAPASSVHVVLGTRTVDNLGEALVDVVMPPPGVHLVVATAGRQRAHAVVSVARPPGFSLPDWVGAPGDEVTLEVHSGTGALIRQCDATLRDASLDATVAGVDMLQASAGVYADRAAISVLVHKDSEMGVLWVTCSDDVGQVSMWTLTVEAPTK